MGEELARRLVHQLAALATENEELRGEVDALDEQGLALLHYAALCALPRLVPELAQHGADLNLRTGSGLSPLHIAAHVGAADVARALVIAGANPSCGDAQGLTPSQRCVRRRTGPQACAHLPPPRPSLSPCDSAAAAGHLDLAHHLFLAADAYRQSAEGGTPMATAGAAAAAAAVMALSTTMTTPSSVQSTPPAHPLSTSAGGGRRGGGAGGAGMALAPWSLRPSASVPAPGPPDNTYIPGTPGSGPLASSHDGATTPSAGSTPCDGYSVTHSLTGEEEDMGREMLERAFASMSLHGARGPLPPQTRRYCRSRLSLLQRNAPCLWAWAPPAAPCSDAAARRASAARGAPTRRGARLRQEGRWKRRRRRRRERGLQATPCNGAIHRRRPRPLRRPGKLRGQRVRGRHTLQRPKPRPATPGPSRVGARARSRPGGGAATAWARTRALPRRQWRRARSGRAATRRGSATSSARARRRCSRRWTS